MLAQHCDLIVAESTARFVYPESRVGFTGGVAASLASRIPYKFALEFLLLGEPFSAERAYMAGMINRVCDPGQGYSVAHTWAKLLRDGAPRVIEALKRFCESTLRQSPSEVLARTRAELEDINSGTDSREGAKAALERRQPRWQEYSKAVR